MARRNSSVARAWVQHGEERLWIIVPIIEQLDDGKVRVEAPDGTQEIKSEWHRHDASHDRDLEDAGLMSDLNEAALLKLLARRFARDAIYTWTGDILLSVNPYRTIPQLYEAHNQQPDGWTPKSGAPAHIYAVGA